MKTKKEEIHRRIWRYHLTTSFNICILIPTQPASTQGQMNIIQSMDQNFLKKCPEIEFVTITYFILNIALNKNVEQGPLIQFSHF